MRVALLADTHWGVRAESPIFLEAMEQFYTGCFFPKLKQEGIDTIIHCGDVFDRRKYISFVTANRFRMAFKDPVVEANMKVIAIPGNHDCPFHNTVKVNGVREILADCDNFEICDTPTSMWLGDEGEGAHALFIPWICEDNEKVCLSAIEDVPARYCFGHFELKGFEMYKGQLMETGRDHKILSKFEQVFTGHYHEPSVIDNVMYLGAWGEMTWSDAGCDRGFHILDLESGDLESIKNPWPTFQKVFYSGQRPGDVDLSELSGKIVKLVVQEKKDPHKFDKFIEAMEEAGGIVSVVDDHHNLDVTPTNELIPDGDVEVFKVFTDYVRSHETGVDTERLIDLFNRLYKEAEQRA